MSNTNTGGPAFPFPAYTYPNGEINHGEGGMTLRDYFAAKAMQGLMSTERANTFVDEIEGLENDDGSGTLFVHTKFLALEAYMIADAMLKAREA